jgi:hypothetical protein
VGEDSALSSKSLCFSKNESKCSRFGSQILSLLHTLFSQNFIPLKLYLLCWICPQNKKQYCVIDHACWLSCMLKFNTVSLVMYVEGQHGNDGLVCWRSIKCCWSCMSKAFVCHSSIKCCWSCIIVKDWQL